jgi:hypothetical protein
MAPTITKVLGHIYAAEQFHGDIEYDYVGTKPLVFAQYSSPVSEGSNYFISTVFP